MCFCAPPLLRWLLLLRLRSPRCAPPRLPYPRIPQVPSTADTDAQTQREIHAQNPSTSVAVKSDQTARPHLNKGIRCLSTRPRTHSSCACDRGCSFAGRYSRPKESAAALDRRSGVGFGREPDCTHHRRNRGTYFSHGQIFDVEMNRQVGRDTGARVEAGLTGLAAFGLTPMGVGAGALVEGAPSAPEAAVPRAANDEWTRSSSCRVQVSARCIRTYLKRDERRRTQAD